MDNNIRSEINTLQNKIAELKKNGKTDPFDLEIDIIHTMPEFYDSYPSLVKRLCRNEQQDNSFLYKMLETLEKVNNGETTMTQAEVSLGDELATKYLYPIVNKENLKK